MDNMGNRRAKTQEGETTRVDAFSDGVFAIAITLLVLDLKVPPPEGLHGNAGLAQSLAAQWPSYLSFLISFSTILIMWVNHHNLFKYIKRIDGLFLFLNGLLLLTVATIPFSTALLAEYIGHAQASTAAAAYAGVFLFNCLTFNMLWRYAAKGKRLLDKNTKDGLIIGINRQAMTGVPLYLLAFFLAFISFWASVTMCMLLAVFFAVTGSTHRILIVKQKPRAS